MTAAPTAATARPGRLLALPDFRRLWCGHSVSLLGDQVSILALPLTAVLVLHAGAGAMGLLTAAGMLPSLLFSLPAGAWSDRHGRRRRTMVAADLVRAALVLTVPVAALARVLSLPQLYLVAFGVGALGTLFTVADASLFTAVVPAKRYVAANSLLHGSRAVSFLAGPSLGGLLVQVVTAPYAVAVDAVSFLGSALFLRRIRAIEPPVEPPGSGSLAAGLRYLRRSATIRPALLGTATLNLFNFMFIALFTLYATRTLDISPGTLGMVLGAGAIGTLLGSVLTGRLTRMIGVGPTLITGMVLFPVPLLLVPLADRPGATSLVLVFASEFGSGMGMMMLDIAAGSITAAVVPARMRARVSGAFQMVNYGVRPLGSLAGGALGATLGVRPALWIGATGALLGVLWLLPSPIRRMRTLPAVAEKAPVPDGGIDPAGAPPAR